VRSATGGVNSQQVVSYRDNIFYLSGRNEAEGKGMGGLSMAMMFLEYTEAQYSETTILLDTRPYLLRYQFARRVNKKN